MISLSTRYCDIVNSNDYVSDWLIQLYYDNEGSTEFTGYSGNGITVDGVFYRDTVQNFGDIIEQINLVKSTGTISNITFDIINQYPNDTGFLVEELWGTRKYFNRKIKIYGIVGKSNPDDDSVEWINNISDLPLLFEGRFLTGKHDEKTVKITAEYRQPWSGLSLCSASTSDGIVIPVVYGDYTSITSSISNPADISSLNAKVWPAPIAPTLTNNISAYTYDALLSLQRSNSFCLSIMLIYYINLTYTNILTYFF